MTDAGVIARGEFVRLEKLDPVYFVSSYLLFGAV
jgi:hypothetical protein